MKNFIITILVIALVGLGIYFLIPKSSPVLDTTQQKNNTQSNTNTNNTQKPDKTEAKEVVIGKSVQGKDIVAYNYGQGDKRILFVGGIHGGYEWNTTLVAYQLMDYLNANPSAIPSNVKVTVIPVLNPDGLSKVATTTVKFTKADISASQKVQIAGRYNANTVDLNRNFDCDWKSVGKWQSLDVSGGSYAFSEPESMAIKNYVGAHNISTAVVWYSSAGGVYASSCDGAILPQTTAIASVYSAASGYKNFQSFDFYKTTGDMTNWFAKNNIPAISVILTTHVDTEWNKNVKGIDALLQYFAK